MTELTPNTKTWRVLVIDDRTATLKLIEAILLPEGATVFLLEDAKYGLEAVREYDINLILLDIAMPYLNGWDFQQMLRSEHEFDHVAVIGCSAMAMAGDQDKI
jgi:CheY-like chemotaxis protein